MPRSTSTKPSRQPSNIPLRTLTHSSSAPRLQHPRDPEEATSFLRAGHGAGAGSSFSGYRIDKPGSDSDDDDDDDVDASDSWVETGDIGDQLDAEDPLRARLNNSIDEPGLAGLKPRHLHRPATKAKRDKKQVRIHDDATYYHHDGSHHQAVIISKEAIEPPHVVAFRPSTAQRALAAIMPGSGKGFTGKPLIYFTSIFVSLGVFLFGYDQGVMSGIITGPEFKDYFNHPSTAEIGTMVAILEIGALISSLMVGKIGDIIGRRRTILYGSMIFFVGGALQTFANGMPMMMVGRIIAGLGVGSLSTIVPVYQSEISPPHNRGKLACIEFSGNIIGYTTSVWVDYFCGFIKSNAAWRVPLFMQCVMGGLLGLGSLLIVESPRWLLDNDHDEEGIVVIANLYGGGDIHNAKAREEYREIKMNVLLQRQEGERTYSDMFRRYRTRVFIAMSAQALAQLNGINVISYYAPLVFESAGWEGQQAVLMTGINGITYFLSTIPPWYIVDTWGRRLILLSGAVAMAISLSLISYFIFLDIKATPTLVVVFVMIYNAAFGYSWGPIPWLYPPEILPLSIRSKGASLSTATNWACNWLVGEMTPILQELIGWRLYLVHAFFCAASFVIVYFIYPETSGVRLEDMNSIFGDATTTIGTPASMGTPAFGPQDDSMVRAGSPVPSLDMRGRPLLAPQNNFPGLDIDPPNVTFVDGRPQYEQGQAEGGVAGWISRVVGRSQSRARSGSVSNRNRRYTPLDNEED
ncbi:and other transporter-domain-containing protein [Coniella lustricola]|uniref:And other transporter-domain-containing protein n=1 Tax=Coniella lustricola TaxID=2025994 RepID=A0A2T3A3G4_9PEZI|nr:and other transporter-domain-containing protein [Coniella lustricola]